MAHLVLIAVMFVAAIVCIIRANIIFIFYQILDEVNAKRPLSQQTSFVFVNLKMFDIQSQHEAFFPSSQKRKQFYIWTGIGLALLFSAFLSCIVWPVPQLNEWLRKLFQ
jgi:hypothetical protein